jgi:hypothetical protein
MKLRLEKGEAADKGVACIIHELCEHAHRAAETADALTDSTVFELRKTVKSCARP